MTAGEDRGDRGHPGDGWTRRMARAAKGGDTSSFAALYETIAPALHAWAELRIRPGLRTRLSPEDLAQEVWFRAWRALDRYDPDVGSFRGWVFQIAKNVLLEAFRSLREPQRPGTPGPTTKLFALQNLPDSATAISRRMARDETLKEFADMVRGLEEEDQKLVVHCGLEGLGYRDAAGRMGITDAAVAKRWQRLRGKLVERGVPDRLLA